MSNIKVESIPISELLRKLYQNDYLIPKFQRDFVWSVPDIQSLATSIIEKKPIGMITVWNQEFESALEKENIWLLDRDGNDQKKLSFSKDPNNKRPAFNVILDGKQRSTAIAMAFGGLRTTHGSLRFSGQYFLDVKEEETSFQVKFLKNNEIKKKALHNTDTFVKEGLFPLDLDRDDDFGMKKWQEHIRRIDNKELYVDPIPSNAEIAKRADRLEEAAEGIRNTLLAVYTVPVETQLGEICEIFDTLNQTGQKVSTLDLIHSWVYAATEDKGEPIEVRNGISQISELDGANEWFEIKPDLAAQMLAFTEIAKKNQTPPREVSGVRATRINSIKAQDLLRLSDQCWKEFFEKSEIVASFMKDFQLCVAGGLFSQKQCPYPGIINIYIALRWKLEFEPETLTCEREHIDKLFKAFFWRAVFDTRYDQGAMTKPVSDLKSILFFLENNKNTKSISDWTEDAEAFLSDLFEEDVQAQITTNLSKWVRDGNSYKGAISAGLKLLFFGRARQDFMDPSISIVNLENKLDLHHIIPKSWWDNNFVELNIDENEAKAWRDSITNMIPLSPGSNKTWKARSPATAFSQFNITKKEQIDMLRRYYVDKYSQEYLEGGYENLNDFLRHRSQVLVTTYQKLLAVT